jgi:hypothetical protein
VVDEVKQYYSTDDWNRDSVAYEVINLIHAFNTLFSDFDWKSSQQPAAINRNYLMHGMYKYKDVQKYDCVKIMLLLRSLLRVHSYIHQAS